MPSNNPSSRNSRITYRRLWPMAITVPISEVRSSTFITWVLEMLIRTMSAMTTRTTFTCREKSSTVFW